MNTFKRFLENKMYSEVAPPAPSGGVGAPGALPGGSTPPPPMPMGGGMPPMPPMGGGGMGGMGMPPTPGAAPSGTPEQLKATNVWDVLEKVLGKNPN